MRSLAFLSPQACGNVYVIGSSYNELTNGFHNSDYDTVKYDSDGNQVWVRNYDKPAGSDDQASAMAMDNLGSIYVTGTSYSGTGYDYATIKYGPDGNQVWVARYDGLAGADDGAVSVVVDEGGGIYVTGASHSGTSFDYVTVKYDPNGNQLWEAHHDGPASGYDEAVGLAVDTAGNLYVT